MTYFSRLSAAPGLVSGMAQRLDVDLSAKICAAPDVEGRAFRSMVMQCAGCRHQNDCSRLQDAHPALDEAPDYCLNKGRFES